MLTNIIKQSSISSPKNAAELAESIGAELDEGVQVALFPSLPENASLGDGYAYGPGVTAFPIFADIGSWGTRLLDIVLSDSGRVKWWKVREYARDYKLGFNKMNGIIPVSWQGPIIEIPEKYFVAGLGIRFYNAGPWFWPKEESHLEDNLEVLKGFISG